MALQPEVRCWLNTASVLALLVVAPETSRLASDFRANGTLTAGHHPKHDEHTGNLHTLRIANRLRFPGPVDSEAGISRPNRCT